MTLSALGSSPALTLTWVKVNDWLMVTECGNYRCRKMNANELTDDKGNLLFQPPLLRYQLYGPNGMTLGARQVSFADCRRLAQSAHPASGDGS